MQKSLKLNHRRATLPIVSQPYSIPVSNNYRVIPTLSTNQMTTSNNNNNNNNNNTDSSQLIIPSSINQQEQQDVSDSSSLKTFHSPQMTTAVSPVNNCHTEYDQTVKPISVPSTKTLRIRQDQNVLKRKSKSTVIIHVIDGWKIHESLEPFQQQENNSSSSKKQEQHVNYGNPNIHQWNINEVCSFFEHVLGKNCYTPIIKEHLIDGTALLLLQEEHLRNTFKMPVENRLKLLNRINELKHGDLSLL
ncbi:unnamed protein product [Rotaria sordida]|uniref:SAM domain-containing protein n=1 Tax=Rotaria sordida TaxID=392033 RepID=A0A815CM56_9BILA|nr:unnamed protein product [Rotaria sordida]